MIEIKNISKTYRTKKGLEVQALKNVSLNFPNTGMVFVLGKSGSGKSTLLNVLGGLDSYDSGEFIIKGKSSQDFTQADFDSYRNTLIGFIFQEYNILDEFTIGANIALALQLQGKKADSAMVNNILDEVDLTGFGNRKPNELSGGQKQRVAIARALIKNPDIIMADEPTGALDSTTGRQVFDTLKKLSKDKLVIIVSHDREFAEYYGDRVIEFKDGEVLSDITKYEAAADVKSEGLKVIDNRIMQVKRGYKLTNKDLDMINTYLEKSESDSYFSLDGRTNESFKQIAMISDDGSKQSFKDTDNEEVAKNSNSGEYKMIRSRLPLKHSLRIGLSSLKAKPIKLIFTIILSMVAFGLFGMADTFASFNSTTSLVSSLMDSNQDHIAIGRSMYAYGDVFNMTDEFIDNINENSKIKAKGVYTTPNHSYGYDISSNFNIRNLPNNQYYGSYVKGLMEMNSEEFAERNITITGNVATNFDEIVITQYLFESFQKYGYDGKNIENENVKIDSEDIGDANKFLSKNLTIQLDSNIYKVVGIADTNLDANKYQTLKEMTSEPNYGTDEYKLFQTLRSEIKYGYHSLGFMYKGSITNLANSAFGTAVSGNKTFYINDLGSSYIATYDMLLTSGKTFTLKSGITSLSKEQFMIGSSEFMNHLNNLEVPNVPYEYEAFKAAFLNGDYDEYLEMDYRAVSYTEEGFQDEDVIGKKTIVGIYESDGNWKSKAAIIDNETYNKYAAKPYGLYQYAIGIMPTSRADVEALVKMANTETENLDKSFYILSDATNTISEFGEMIEELAKIFIYIGIGFALFAALMLMNYIATSISYKKREIGILRAVGAKGTDVFGIFCSESMYLAIINFILATIATIGICLGINAVVRNTLGLPITLLTVGIRQVALIFGVSILTAFIASLIPVLNIARKKPIDAIRKK